MEAEVAAEVGAVVGQVAGLMTPLERAYAAEVARLQSREEDLARYVALTQDLQRRTANLE